MQKREDLKKSLKQFFGFSNFKGLQEPVILNLLNGNDTFVIMPTGGGKSMCYQLPALLCPGTALVVSPLIALMKNQVDTIRGISTNSGIAHVLNSSQNKTETLNVKQDLINGVTKLLFVAPESLAKKEIIDFFKTIKISFLAVDEAHCISEWSHNFRTSYLIIEKLIQRYLKSDTILALTATATH